MLEPIEKLIAVLGRLPSVGRRSAERIALRLVRDRSRGLIRDLAAALDEVERSVRLCGRCGGLTDAGHDPCRLCADASRDGTVLCVVEQPGDILPIEESGAFHGRYHALMGRISPMRGEGPRQVRVEDLLRRVAEESVAEVILALDTDVESDATCAYLAEALAPLRVRVTRLATGLPAGSGIAYSDPVTLSRALQGRRET
jgi:recombination protein RecR